MKTSKVVFVFMFLDERLRKSIFRIWSFCKECEYTGTTTDLQRRLELIDKAIGDFTKNKKNAEFIANNKRRLRAGDGFFITVTVRSLSDGRLLVDDFTAGRLLKSLYSKLGIK